jgi:hypothetical protein
LSDFRLDQGEQFHSVYDYIADWQYKIHFEFEAILPLIQGISQRLVSSSTPAPVGGTSFGGTTPTP